MKDKKLTNRQIAAMHINIELGMTLQQDHPEIAELYKKGYTLSKIVDKLNIMSDYNASSEVARVGVYCAIAGYDGKLGIDSYNGLINSAERTRIGKEHIKKVGIDLAKKMRKERKGIFTWTREQHSEAGKKGGIKGGRRSVIARGFTLWTEDEISLAYQLSQQPEYQWSEGKYKGKLNLKKITHELIKKGYSERTPNAVGRVIREERKSLEDRV